MVVASRYTNVVAVSVVASIVTAVVFVGLVGEAGWCLGGGVLFRKSSWGLLEALAPLLTLLLIFFLFLFLTHLPLPGQNGRDGGRRRRRSIHLCTF